MATKAYPTLTQEDMDNGRYQYVGNHHFTEEGKYVPLANRPPRTSQEKVLKGHSGVLDVGITGFSTFVYITDMDEKENVMDKMREEMGETLHKIIDDNSHRESDTVLIFR